jgi:TRAP-type mannitol/chloroaromatic compound transport system permease small subunit
MRAWLRMAHAIDALTEWLGNTSAALVLVTIAVGFYNVVARYMGRYIGVNLSSNFYIEAQWYLYSLIFFLGFAYILKHDINVRVDFLYVHWSDKTKAWVNLVGTFCLMGIWVTFNPVLASWGRLPSGAWGPWEISPDPDGLPRAPLKSMIIVAFLTLLLQAVAQIIKYIAVIGGHTEVADELAADVEELEA